METNTEAQPAEQDTPKTKESPFAILFELETIAANGRRAAFEVLKSILGEHKTDFEQAHFSRYCLHPAPAQYLPDLLEALGVKLSVDKLAEDVTSGVVMHLTSGSTSLSPGVAAILDEAGNREVALGALTSLPEAAAQNVVKKLGLTKRDITLFSAADEIDEVFPRSDTWLKLAKQMGRSPRRCLVFASHKMSCRSALAAGMNCVAVPDEFTAFQDFGGADKVLDTLEDVPAQELLAELLPKACEARARPGVMTSPSEPAGNSGSALPTTSYSDLAPIDRLVAIMRLLRSEKGCPWDREQTLETLKQYLMEESYEVLDAIDSGDRKLLEEELGDVLLQVVFQAQICSEEGSFAFNDVATHISEKLVRRHPHIFGDVDVADADEVVRNWEAIKSEEKGGTPRSATDGVPRSMPALRKADKIQKKVARVGFDWDDVHDVVAKLDEELTEIKQAMATGDPDRIKEEIGDLLFAGVNLSRFLGHDAEELLDETIDRFMGRFRGIEDRLHQQGRKVTDCKLAELDRIWEQVKADEGTTNRH